MKLPLKILIHTIYWLCFLMFSFVFSLGAKHRELAVFIRIMPSFIINAIWAAVIFYLFYFYFIRFFEKGEFVKYLIFSITSSAAITFLFLPIHKFFIPNFEIFRVTEFGPPIIGTFIIAQCGCLVRGFENWFSDIRLKSELENRNLRNELDLLKSQINPHFLFNTLNNIDSLIHTIPDNASRSLITLSDMLRYMIYETKSDHVPLQKELTYLRNYIQLQQLRFENSKYIKINFPENCSGIQIAPMLLVPFIENAFKYSVYLGDYPVIEFFLECDKNKISFQSMNYFDCGEMKQKRPGGVGLENVKRRLELLYPNKHHLSILKENNTFKVELNIQIV